MGASLIFRKLENLYFSRAFPGVFRFREITTEFNFVMSFFQRKGHGAKATYCPVAGRFCSGTRAFEKSGSVVSQAMCVASASTLERILPHEAYKGQSNA